MTEPLHLQIVLIFTFGFGFASVLGYLAHQIKLSPILGYLLAGYVIGPYFPGFIAMFYQFYKLFFQLRI